MQIEKTHHLPGLNASCVLPGRIVRLGATHHAFRFPFFSPGYFPQDQSS